MKPSKKEEPLSKTMRRFLQTDPDEVKRLEEKEKRKKEKGNSGKKDNN